MKNLVYAALVGIILSIILGIAYYFATKGYQQVNITPPYTALLLEAFKTLLTFSLVTTGGVVLKAFIDNVLEKDRTREINTNRHEETRKIILKEFTTIFSEFYSIRKLYHSALSHQNIYEKDSTDFKKLVREVLQKSVDLEGRYGTLKVMVIIHFNLPGGEFQTKSVAQLKEEISTTKDEKKLARLRLDLLGESYDEWRHAFEKNKKIRVDNEFWTGYDLLLKFLEQHG